jgi:hypothetical protein
MMTSFHAKGTINPRAVVINLGLHDAYGHGLY